MPHRRPRRSPATVRRLFLSDGQLSLVPQPALSQVPVHSPRSLAQQASEPACCRWPIPTSSSPCPNNWHRSHSATSACSTTCCFAPPLKPCSPIAADPRHLGARIGVLAVLHTWSQDLRHHPHLHCLVPAGGLALDHSRWIACRPGFFLPVRVLSRLFRGKMLAFLQQAYKKGELRCLGTISQSRRPTSVPLPVAAAAFHGMGRLCQTTLRRTRACAAVPGPLYSPRCHRQRQASRSR